MAEAVYSGNPNEPQAGERITIYLPPSMLVEISRRVSKAKERDPDFTMSRLGRQALREFFRRHHA